MRKLLIGSVALMAMVAAPAMAGDLRPTKKPLYMQAPVPVFTWSGFYIGGNIGYSWGHSESTLSFLDAGGGLLSASGDTFQMNGVIGGAQIGYNWQVQTWVFGLETDFQGSGQDGGMTGLCAGGSLASGPPFNGTCTPGHIGDTRPFDVAADAVTSILTHDLQWFGTVRGRIGHTIMPTLLVYATGGLAYGQVDTKAAVSGTNITGTNGTNVFTITTGSAAFSNSTTKVGWTLGAGVEGVLGGNWTGKIEYLYIDLGDVSGSFVTPIVTTSGGALTSHYSSHITDNILRVGINYKFAGPAY